MLCTVILNIVIACLILNVLAVLSQEESSLDVSPRVLLYKVIDSITFNMLDYHLIYPSLYPYSLRSRTPW